MTSGIRQVIYPRGSSNAYSDVIAGGGIADSVHSALPTASVDNRGVRMRTEGATAVADTFAVGAKMSNNAYTAGRVRVDGIGYLLARVDSPTALVGDTSTQALFASAGDALSVEAGMTYRFRAAVRLTTGATSASVSFLFGGTATFTTCNYVAFGIQAASGTAGTAAMQNGEAATATVVVAAGAGVNKRFFIEGEFEINAAGTLIPSIAFSADPQGDETVNVGSFFEAWPIGAAPVTAIGPWA